MALLKTIEEIKKYVAIDANTDIESILPYIEDAEEQFIKDLISEPMYEAISTQYNADPQTLSAEYLALLPYIHRSLAHYAMFLWVNVGGVSLSDTGINTHTSNNSMPAPQWRVDKLEKSLLLSGDTHAEKLLQYLEGHKTDYPLWTASAAYTLTTGLFINSAMDFSRFVTISDSRRLFLKLKPYIEYAEQLKIKKLICKDLFAELKTQIEGNTLTAANIELLNKIRPLVARLALLKAIPELRITIGEKGIYIVSYSDSINSKAAASDTQVKALIMNLTEMAGAYTEDIKALLENDIDNYPLYRDSPCYTSRPDPGPSFIPENDGCNKHFSV